MSFNVHLDNDITISAGDELSLFESALKSGYTINHSCLSGRCSECKALILEGKTIALKNQEGLSQKEIDDGYCLSCVSKPITNLKLSKLNFIEGLLPEIKTTPAKINRLHKITNNIIKLSLRTPPGKTLKFIPGQHVDLSVKGIVRSYSISSIPTEKEIVFYIKKYQNGKFSKYLFNEAKVNDLLRIIGPKGTYFLTKKNYKKILFLSTGTGIAPNISILKDLLMKSPNRAKDVILIHGQQHVKDHVYDLKSTFPNVKIIKATSREKSEDFYNGYVHHAAIDLGLDLKQTIVFACGNLKMIKDAKKQLMDNGLPENNFKSDAFVESN